jgi:hypothetical protein
MQIEAVAERGAEQDFCGDLFGALRLVRPPRVNPAT